jgi:putative transposase
VTAFFIGYNLNQTIPDLVENFKTSSNHWIKEKKIQILAFVGKKPALLDRQGYGAYTHSHSQMNTVPK